MPDISKIKLPSGNEYDIKDAVAREMISGGISFIICDLTDPSTVPNAVDGGELSPADAQKGAFYLVPSETEVGVQDYYDEYVVINEEVITSAGWEKIGDTQIDLSSVVTNVTLNKNTDTVIGSGATFTITQPTIDVGRVAASTASTSTPTFVSDITGLSASGDSVIAITELGTPTTDLFLTGVEVVTEPRITLSGLRESGAGRIKYVESQGEVTTTKLGATASDGAVTATGDNVTVITGLGTPTTQSAVKSVSPTTAKLATTSITGVSGSTTPSVVQGRSSQTTATGVGTASTTNTDWLKGVSVSNETLILGAATMNTQTTYSANAPTTITVPTAANATTVATGSTTTSGSGASVVTGVSVGDTFNAVTGYANPATDTVIGTSSTFNVTNPTITLASGTSGDVTVATGVESATTKYLVAVAGGTELNTYTETAITALGTPTTDTVLGTDTAITATKTYGTVTANASGANTAWNNKDQKTVLNNSTSINVTKG